MSSDEKAFGIQSRTPKSPAQVFIHTPAARQATPMPVLGVESGVCFELGIR